MFSGWARRMLGAVEEKSAEPPKLPLASRALRSDEAHEAGAETPGSLRHGSECNPCAWYWKPQGCLRGKECGYCHICPEGEVKLRKKAKLAAMRGGVSPSSTASLSPSKAQRDLVMGQEIEAEVVDRQPSMSVGSTLHGTGECKPCAWFWKPKGCQNGADCRHCHMCSQGEIRLRKKAKERGSREEADRSPLEPLKVSIEGMDEPAYGHEPQWVEPTSLADVAPPPGLAMSSSVPSKGSAAHGTGLCRPCAWLWKPGGCQNGAECRHCHLCPDGELKARRKVKAELARQESLEQEILSSPLALSLAQMLDEDDASPADPFGLDSEGVDAAHIYPSEGSKLHGSGFCRPCAWFWKPKGCDNGRDCHHCHLCPQEEIKNRRKAKQYMQNEGSPMMWPATWTPLSGVDSMMTQTPGSVYPGSELSESMLTPLELGASPGVRNWDWDAFGAASPESPKFAIELAKSLPVPSSGSELHGTGKCRPCAWFHKSAGCSNGEACAHCHLCPEDEIRSRKKAKEAALRAGALEPKRDADGRNPRTVRIAPLLA